MRNSRKRRMSRSRESHESLERDFQPRKKKKSDTQSQSTPQQDVNNDPAVELKQLQDELAQMKQTIEAQSKTIENVKQGLRCNICLETLRLPQILIPCGHTACLKCLKAWFLNPPKSSDSASEHDAEPVGNGDDAANTNGPANYGAPAGRDVTQIQKHCPHCRHIVRDRPVPVYVLRDLADSVDPDEKLEEEGQGIDVWKNIFPPDVTTVIDILNPGQQDNAFVRLVVDRFQRALFDTVRINRNSPFFDQEDNVTRCSVCMHEVWGSRCSNERCGREFYQGSLRRVSDSEDTGGESSFVNDVDDRPDTPDLDFLNDASDTLSEQDTYELPETDGEESSECESHERQGRRRARRGRRRVRLSTATDEDHYDTVSHRASDTPLSESDDFIPRFTRTRTRRPYIVSDDDDGDEDNDSVGPRRPRRRSRMTSNPPVHLSEEDHYDTVSHRTSDTPLSESDDDDDNEYPQWPARRLSIWDDDEENDEEDTEYGYDGLDLLGQSSHESTAPYTGGRDDDVDEDEDSLLDTPLSHTRPYRVRRRLMSSEAESEESIVKSDDDEDDEDDEDECAMYDEDEDDEDREDEDEEDVDEEDEDEDEDERVRRRPNLYTAPRPLRIRRRRIPHRR